MSAPASRRRRRRTSGRALRRAAARGPQRHRRRPAHRRLPPARRLGGDRRRVPAPRRPAAGRPRRRPLRHLPAARPALRPGDRRAASGAATRSRSTRCRSATASSGSGWPRDAPAGATDPRGPTGCPYCGTGCGLRRRGRPAGGRRGEGRSAAPGQPRRDVSQAARPARRAEREPTAPRCRCGATRSEERWRARTWRQAIGRARAAAADRRASAHGPDAIAFYISRAAAHRGLLRRHEAREGVPRDEQRRLELAPVHVSARSPATRRRSAPTARPPPTPTSTRRDRLLLLGSNTVGLPPDPLVADPPPPGRGRDGDRRRPAPRRRRPQAADLHLPVRPGADLPLLSAMLRVLDDEDLVDRAFLARHTEGAEEALRGRRRVAAGARRGGLRRARPREIVAAARTLRRGAGARWRCGRWAPTSPRSGRSRTGRSSTSAWRPATSAGRATGPLSLTGQPNAMGGRESGGLAHLLPGYRKVDRPRATAPRCAGLWDIPAGAPGISPDPGPRRRPSSSTRSRTAASRSSGSSPRTRSSRSPTPQRFAAALRRAELVVVQDAYHPTETGRARPPRAARGAVGREGGHADELRAPRVAHAPGGRPARRGAARLGDLRPRRPGARPSRAVRAGRRAAEVHAEYVRDRPPAGSATRPASRTSGCGARARCSGRCPRAAPTGDDHAGTERLYASRPLPDAGRARADGGDAARRARRARRTPTSRSSSPPAASPTSGTR